MSTVTINGRTYSGNNVNIINGKVIIDGVEQTPKDEKKINIVVNGNIESLKVDSCEKVGVIGYVGTISTASGDVEVRGQVTGSIATMSGDVDCHQVGGSVTTMSGDITHKR